MNTTHGLKGARKRHAGLEWIIKYKLKISLVTDPNQNQMAVPTMIPMMEKNAPLKNGKIAVLASTIDAPVKGKIIVCIMVMTIEKTQSHFWKETINMRSPLISSKYNNEMI